MTKILKCESGQLGGNSTFPDHESGVYFSGKFNNLISPEVFLSGPSTIYMSDKKKLIECGRASSYRYFIIDDLSNETKYEIELKLINPQIITDKERIVKELI